MFKHEMMSTLIPVGTVVVYLTLAIPFSLWISQLPLRETLADTPWILLGTPDFQG